MLSTDRIQHHLAGNGLIVEGTWPLVFVLDDDQDQGELVRQCRTVGYDHLLGERAGHKELRVVHGGPRDWQGATGHPLARP